MRFYSRFLSTFRSSLSTRLWTVLLLVLIALLAAIFITRCTASYVAEPPAANSEGLEQDAADESGPNKVNPSQIPDSSFIYDVSIEELATADTYMDGKTVQVVGEVVGDRIISENDDKCCWITLQSTSESDSEVSVYMPVSSTKGIDTYGAYGRHGTTLQVRGTFNLACTDHQGASEVHAENVTVISRGFVENAVFSLRRLLPGIALLIVGCLIMIAFNYLRERER